MHIETVRTIAEQLPFRAFRLHLLEVRHFDVTHPEVIYFDDHAVHLAAITSPSDFLTIDPNCISRIQYIPKYDSRDDEEIPI